MPEMWKEVALVDVHESVDEPGALYEPGEALMVQVGAGFVTVTVTESYVAHEEKYCVVARA